MSAQLKKSGKRKRKGRILYRKFKMIAYFWIVDAAAGKKRAADKSFPTACPFDKVGIKYPVRLLGFIKIHYPAAVSLTRHIDRSATVQSMYAEAYFKQRRIKLSRIAAFCAYSYTLSVKRPTEQQQSVTLGGPAASGRLLPAKLRL